MSESNPINETNPQILIFRTTTQQGCDECPEIAMFTCRIRYGQITETYYLCEHCKSVAEDDGVLISWWRK